MKIILSKKTSFELTKEQAQDLKAEMKYTCNEVSMFPVMKEVLALMEV